MVFGDRGRRVLDLVSSIRGPQTPWKPMPHGLTRCRDHAETEPYRSRLDLDGNQGGRLS